MIRSSALPVDLRNRAQELGFGFPLLSFCIFLLRKVSFLSLWYFCPFCVVVSLCGFNLHFPDDDHWNGGPFIYELIF